MADRAPIGLDDPVFRGRLRRIQATEELLPRALVTLPSRPSAKYFNNNLTGKPAPITEVKLPEVQPIQEVERKPLFVPEPVDLVPEAQIIPKSSFVPTSRTETKRRRSYSQTALMAMAVVIFLVGIFVSAMTIKTNSDAKAQVSALSQHDDNAPPDETKPTSSSISSYQVAPELPKFIKIPSLSVNGRVKSLDVTKDNALQAPRNIYDAGWYSASAKPGDSGSNGAILIDGHVHGPTKPGIFSSIKNLKSNDIVTIQRGDDKVFNYKVVKVQNYDSKTLDMGIALASIQPGVQGLNLITCGGKFNQSTGQYEQRTIVFAVLQS
jgi:hypothetical protein